MTSQSAATRGGGGTITLLVAAASPAGACVRCACARSICVNISSCIFMCSRRSSPGDVDPVTRSVALPSGNAIAHGDTSVAAAAGPAVAEVVAEVTAATGHPYAIGSWASPVSVARDTVSAASSSTSSSSAAGMHA
jgi:hypothetical protein